MKTTNIFLIMIILSLSPTAFAQNNSDSNKKELFEFKKFSLLLRFGEFLRLSSFNGTLISTKVHFSNKYAFRFGIGVDASKKVTSKDNNSLTSDSLIYSLEYNTKYSMISFDSQFLYYVNPQQKVKFYFGVGPYYSIKISDNSRTKAINPENYYGRKDFSFKTNEWGIGVSAAYGIEYFVKRDISLIAEYGFVYTYISLQTEKIDVKGGEAEKEKFTQEDKIWGFHDLGARIGLSFYF